MNIVRNYTHAHVVRSLKGLTDLPSVTTILSWTFRGQMEKAAKLGGCKPLFLLEAAIGIEPMNIQTCPGYFYYSFHYIEAVIRTFFHFHKVFNSQGRNLHPSNCLRQVAT